MKWWCSTALVLATLALCTARPADANQRHMWWHSDELRTELGLAEDQTTALQEIFQTVFPDLRRLMQELRAEEQELSDLIDAEEVDEWKVTLQIDKVEAARSALGKTRTLMLYRMYRELSSTQRDALREHFSDRARRRDQQRPPSSR